MKKNNKHRERLQEQEIARQRMHGIDEVQSGSNHEMRESHYQKRQSSVPHRCQNEQCEERLSKE